VTQTPHFLGRTPASSYLQAGVIHALNPKGDNHKDPLFRNSPEHPLLVATAVPLGLDGSTRAHTPAAPQQDADVSMSDLRDYAAHPLELIPQQQAHASSTAMSSSPPMVFTLNQSAKSSISTKSDPSAVPLVSMSGYQHARGSTPGVSDQHKRPQLANADGLTEHVRVTAAGAAEVAGSALGTYPDLPPYSADNKLSEYWVSGVDGSFARLPPEKLTRYYSIGKTQPFIGDIMVPGNAALAFENCSFKREVIVMCTDVGDIWFEFVFGQIMMMQDRGYAHIIVYMDNKQHCEQFQTCVQTSCLPCAAWVGWFADDITINSKTTQGSPVRHALCIDNVHINTIVGNASSTGCLDQCSFSTARHRVGTCLACAVCTAPSLTCTRRCLNFGCHWAGSGPLGGY
jgi:hypothetical protein